MAPSRDMGKALMLLLVAAIVAVFFVPFHGKTLWARAQHRGLAATAVYMAREAFHWFSETPRKRSVASAPVAAGRRAPEPAPERILKAPPKERLSPEDRASLERLVNNHAR
jgi:hypothetical protein